MLERQSSNNALAGTDAYPICISLANSRGWLFFSIFTLDMTLGNKTIPKFTHSFQPKGK